LLIADIKGKLGLKEEYSEDFLTSAVFSTFMYLDERWIQKYLNQAVNIRGEQLLIELKTAKFEFWPYFAPITETNSGTEPDVLIYFGNTAVLIEAKNYSGKSGEGIIEDDPLENQMGISTKLIADQLGREYFVGLKSILESSVEIHGDVFCIDDFKLIFLTRHPTFPKIEIEESIKTIAQIDPNEKINAEKKIYWLNWQKAVPIFEKIVLNSLQNTFGHKIAQDLVVFLEKRYLGIFSGFDFLDNHYSFLDESKKASDLKYLFYRKEFRPYWLYLDKLKSQIKTSNVEVFYKKEITPYWLFIEQLGSIIQVNKDSVFYRTIDLPYWNFIKNDVKFNNNLIFYANVEKPY